VPIKYWQTVDLFWVCHTVVPGQPGAVQRLSMPGPGSALEQDNWMLEAFRACERSYQRLVGEVQVERKRASELEAMHRKTQAGS
jgi:hypothetical protein